MQEAAQQAGMARVCAGLSKWVCVEGVWIEQYDQTQPGATGGGSLCSSG